MTNRTKSLAYEAWMLRTTLLALFFLSGCSALIYQVTWERMLFTLFGVDLESITIIVSVFMFGLGVGGILGGLLADRFPHHLLWLYILIELGIALFGFSSPTIIHFFGDTTLSQSEWTTALFSYCILAVPTCLMGATFPILVTHVNQSNHNIGRSVGSLYFANTLGGALGAYFAGFVLLYTFDLVGAINQAAILNLIIATIAWLVFRRE